MGLNLRKTVLFTAITMCLCGFSVGAFAAEPPGPVVPGGITSAGEFPAGGSSDIDVSDDRSLIAFVSSSPDLPGANGVNQIYLRSTLTGSVTLVSTNPAGQALSADTRDPELSGDGRYLFFVSLAPEVVAGFNTHAKAQFYRRDLSSGVTIPVSVQAADHAQGSPEDVADFSVARSGELVGFSTPGTLITTLPAGGSSKVYLRDIAANVLSMVSLTTADLPVAGPAGGVSLSGDGRYIAYSATGTMIASSPPANGQLQVYLVDRYTDEVRMVSVAPGAAAPGDGPSRDPDVADNGSVVYISNATNLTPAVAPALVAQVYLSTVGWPTRVVSHPAGMPSGFANDGSGIPYFSDDGSLVVFPSKASNLVAGTGPSLQAYSYDPSDASVSLLSRAPDGSQANGPSSVLDVTADGLAVGLVSSGTNLVDSTPVPSGSEQSYVAGALAAAPEPTPGCTPDPAAATTLPRLASTGELLTPVVVLFGIGAALLCTGAVLTWRERRRRLS